MPFTLVPGWQKGSQAMLCLAVAAAMPLPLQDPPLSGMPCIPSCWLNFCFTFKARLLS